VTHRAGRPVYRVGETVRVAARAHPGHHRTPGYIKGKTGRIERLHASFRNPETRAYGRDGLPEMPLYLVSFAQADVWPHAPADGGDRIYVDVFEHWLEEA
jgi:nitrile hydratase subunit beta